VPIAVVGKNGVGVGNLVVRRLWVCRFLSVVGDAVAHPEIKGVWKYLLHSNVCIDLEIFMASVSPRPRHPRPQESQVRVRSQQDRWPVGVLGCENVRLVLVTSAGINVARRAVGVDAWAKEHTVLNFLLLIIVKHVAKVEKF